MHVEFRLSEVAHACAFDHESFYRMKQLMARSNRQSGGNAAEGSLGVSQDDTNSKRKDSLVVLSKNRRGHTASDGLSGGFTPQLKVQFVFERLVKLEGSIMSARADRNQHEKLLATNWDGSDIKTRRYSMAPQEVILAALPSSVADCVVKIRLLQLPPPLSSSDEQRVAAAIGTTTQVPADCLPSTPLCIGVAKITLRELLSVRGGVCISMQPRLSMVRAVEELNLNTVATNAMFGKDVGGCAFVTFQVISYSFGRVPTPKLLLYRSQSNEGNHHMAITASTTSTQQTRRQQTPALDDPGSISRQNSADVSPSPDPRFDGGTLPYALLSEGGLQRSSYQQEVVDVSIGRFDSAAVRFVLIPYMVLVDAILRFHDACTWRNPVKTLLLVSILVLVIAADVLDMSIVFFLLSQTVMGLRNLTLFYRIPVTETGVGPLVSPLTSEPEAFLYGRHNVLVNALVRARVFFSQGLQEDCYYELVLIFHLLRRRQRSIILAAILLCLSMCLVSVESIVVLTAFSFLLLYPIILRLPNLVGRKRSKQRKALLTLHSIMKSFQLYRPMRVVRVVQVSLASPKPQPPLLPSTSLHPDGPMYSRESASLAGRMSSAANVESGGSQPLWATHHQRARTFDGSATIRQQMHNASRLTFAVVSFKNDQGPGIAAANKSHQLIGRLQRYLESARKVRSSGMGQFSAPGSTSTLTAEGAASSTAAGKSLLEVFFKDTLGLLHHIRRYSTNHAYVSAASMERTPSVDAVPLSLFVRPPWLIERGDDDGITTTLLAMPSPSSLSVSKIVSESSVEKDAKTMALLAAYLLQAARISIYCPDENGSYCSVILPLEVDGRRLKRFPAPNPCSQPLFQALNEIWLGSMSSSSSITLSADIVLQMVGASGANVGGGTAQRSESFITQSPHDEQPHSRLNSHGLGPFSNRTPRMINPGASYGVLPNQNERSATMRDYGASPITKEMASKRSAPASRNASSHGSAATL